MSVTAGSEGAASSSLHSPAVKDEIRKRLNRLQGQINGIQRMVVEEEY